MTDRAQITVAEERLKRANEALSRCFADISDRYRRIHIAEEKKDRQRLEKARRRVREARIEKAKAELAVRGITPGKTLLRLDAIADISTDGFIRIIPLGSDRQKITGRKTLHDISLFSVTEEEN